MNLIEQTAAWLSDPVNWNGAAGIPTRLAEHLVVSSAALALAVAIALPIGLLVGHTGRGALLAINLANIGRALPTLAVITIVLPITSAFDPQLGFKVYPTIIALVVLGIPPILVNTYVGISGIDRELVESARGMGLNERQVLGRVEIPVALPVLATGIRSAAIQIVATATSARSSGASGSVATWSRESPSATKGRSSGGWSWWRPLPVGRGSVRDHPATRDLAGPRPAHDRRERGRPAGRGGLRPLSPARRRG